jgi:hypothetical protein
MGVLRNDFIRSVRHKKKRCSNSVFLMVVDSEDWNNSEEASSL